MRKSFIAFISLAAAVAALVSCAKETDLNTGEKPLPETETGEMQIFPLTRKDAGKSEIFFIECKNVLWDLNLTFHAPLQPVAGTNPDTLFR